MWWSRARIVRVKCVPQSAFTSWAASSLPVVLDNGKATKSIHFIICFVFALVLDIEILEQGARMDLTIRTTLAYLISHAFEFSKEKKKTLILLRFESYTHKLKKWCNFRT